MANSTDDFKARIDALKLELESCSTQIVNHVTALHCGIPQTIRALSNIDFKNDPRNGIKILQHDVSEMLEMLENKEAMALENEQDINECLKYTKDLNHISEIVELLVTCEESINSSKLIETCTILSTSEQLIQCSSSQNKAHKVLSLLKREHQILKSKFISKLRRLFSHAVQVQLGKIAVVKSSKFFLKDENILLDVQVTISNILLSANHMIIINELTEMLASSIWTLIIRPLWQERKPNPPISTIHEDNSEMLFESIQNYTGQITESNEQSFAMSLKYPFPTFIEYIGQLLQFIALEVLCSNNDAILTFTASLNNSPISFTNKIEQLFISLIPKVESELQTFVRNMERPVFEFEEKLKLYGYDSLLYTDNATGNSDGQTESLKSQQPLLSNVLHNIYLFYASTRRKDALSRAREILLSDYHNTMFATGDATEDDALSAGSIGDLKGLDSSKSFAPQTIRFEECQTSLVSHRLLKLIHELMNQVQKSSGNIASLLYQTARDCIEMFLSIVPMKYVETIESNPRIGAIFYNDCVYICHNCTLLSHKYKVELDRKLENENSIAFIDFIPRLRSIGEAKLAIHVEAQMSALQKNLSQVKLSTTSSNLCNNSQAANDVIRHFNQLRDHWSQVFQESMYLKLISQMYERLLQSAMAPVIEAKHISEQAKFDVHRIFTILLDVLKVLKTNKSPITMSNRDVDINNFDSILNSDALDTFTPHVPSIKRFKVLTDLLQFSLDEISKNLVQKKFSCFKLQEMENILRSFFTPSDEREALMRLLKDITN